MTMSELVLDALRVLGHSPDWTHVEMVAKGLRESRDPEVITLLEDYGRFIALVQEHDVELQFMALDLFSEIRSPGAMARPGERGRLVEDDS
jgi:hypothetical protein